MDPTALDSNTKIAVMGLGYVGLPLAHALGQHFHTIGYDINAKRVEQINKGHDHTLALSKEALENSGRAVYTHNEADLAEAQIYIITAPTPVDKQNQPDLEPVRGATRQVAKYLKEGNIVIFESTVYPGATEEECVPLLDEGSGLKFNEGYYVGYSPERINPGDGEHGLTTIVKVTSGSTPEAAEIIDQMYRKIISAGTFRASSIKVAEAAKVIENTQRDLNIALVNELAILFNKLGIDTKEVLDAAGSKWNFLPFKPGFVGGHCIGVDPYYLTYKAQQVGHHPEVILAGRRINDSMGSYVAERVVRLMLSKRIQVIESCVLVLGLSFKENCPDTRNTKVYDMISTLEDYHTKVDVYDPWVDPEESDYLIKEPEKGRYDAVIIAVGHKQFTEMGIDSIREFGTDNAVIFDVKHLFPADKTDGSL